MEAFPNFRQIILDRSGYGRSKGKPNGNYRRDAQDLWETLDGLRLDQVEIVGDSGGGCVGAIAASLRPGSVKSLTVIEPPFLGIASGKSLEYRKKLQKLVNVTNPLEVPEDAVESFLDILVGSQRIAELKSGTSWQAILDLGTNMFVEARYILDSDLRPTPLSIPTMVVAGTISPLYDLARKVASYWNAGFVSVENAGHLLSRTHPEIFNEHLRSFLAKPHGLSWAYVPVNWAQISPSAPTDRVVIGKTSLSRLGRSSEMSQVSGKGLPFDFFPGDDHYWNDYPYHKC
jgi:pimeloyl-ACP methyl ester carboxylesterase